MSMEIGPCHFVIVPFENAKEVLLDWHNKGFYPISTHIGYTAGMPNGQLHVYFVKRERE